MSLCVAGVALREILTCLQTYRKSFCVTGAIILWQGFQQMSCMFRGSRSTLETSIVILRGKRSTSDVSRCVLYTLHSTLHTPDSLHNLHFTLHTLHSTLYTLHFTLYTLHSTLYTPHSTLCTPPSSAFHSLQCTGTVTGENLQDCSNNLFHKGVLRDCIRWAASCWYIWFGAATHCCVHTKAW